MAYYTKITPADMTPKERRETFICKRLIHLPWKYETIAWGKVIHVTAITRKIREREDGSLVVTWRGEERTLDLERMSFDPAVSSLTYLFYKLSKQ